MMVENFQAESRQIYKILISGSNLLMHSYVRETISYNPHYDILLETDSGDETINCINYFHPDLIIMDVVLIEMGGIEALENILVANPDIKILIISNYYDVHLEYKFAIKGARGYINPTEANGDFLNIIQRVLKGYKHFSSNPQQLKILNRNPQSITGTELYHIHSVLTHQQLKIFKFLGTGYSKNDIKNKLCISPKTVDNHINNIKMKLKLNSNNELVYISSKYMIFNGCNNK